MLKRLTSIPYPWELSLMLLALHGAMMAEQGSGWAIAAMIAHYGLFLLWQPIWRTEQPLNPMAALMFLGGGLVLLLGVNWWLLAFWHALLIGLLGGRVFSSQAKQERIAYLLAASYLIAMLLIWVEPRLLEQPTATSSLGWLAQYVLPLLPANMILLRTPRENNPSGSLDFFYSLMLFLLVVILVLGSFIIENVSHVEYSLVLLRVLFSIAAVLIALSWLWDPRAGFSGLGQLLSRYLLSVGMPFEQWLQRVATSADTEQTASAFLNAALDELQNIPWVVGGTWETEAGRGVFGTASDNHSNFTYHNFQLTLFTRWRLSPALTLHVKLLVQLLGEFYESKLREEQMRGVAYMQAVYETGARLTHDIKNLLQSLSTLCAAAERVGNDEKLVALIQRQLPQLTQRLQLTLDKLQAPKSSIDVKVNATTWWNRLKLRYRDTGIEFSSRRIPAGMEIPGELFDSVADNLLQNAMEKKRTNPNMRINALFDAAPDNDDSKETVLEIMDDGPAIPAEVASQMFKSILPSNTGLGIGLYHASRQARFSGYELGLHRNRNGEVSFRLIKQNSSENQ
jgi:signal transduction histidine kinase